MSLWPLKCRSRVGSSCNGNTNQTKNPHSTTQAKQADIWPHLYRISRGYWTKTCPVHTKLDAIFTGELLRTEYMPYYRRKKHKNVQSTEASCPRFKYGGRFCCGHGDDRMKSGRNCGLHKSNMAAWFGKKGCGIGLTISTKTAQKWIGEISTRHLELT